MTYVVSNRAAANGASVFSNSGAIASITDVAVATVSSASAGANPETLQSIKYNARLIMQLKEGALLLKIIKYMQRNYFPILNPYQCLVERVVQSILVLV